MSKDEVIDVLNEQMECIGTATREEIHRLGLWHQTFHCWVVRYGPQQVPEMLFQLRASDKESYPGLLDTSCAGHLLTGETPADGVRELEEELGLHFVFQDLLPCGTVKMESQMSESYIDREFYHVFLVHSEQELMEYTFQQSEVAGLYWVQVEDFRQLLSREKTEVEATGILLNEENHSIEPHQRSCTIADFTPNTEQYYHLVFEAIKREGNPSI
ncbi:isopentenyldiphosphate isomerase [Paenibacillus shirakamiensis]|uniref:Isopentenyldiphosphate isomerase n=1 Tax=Paenibacillus shirakamiensis TaxID=1265935 RepID=A0ABS4JGS3_9BACL|nr:NUDIX domain-containing protein [Paenibacillus shirakamiensis]MBP2000917.1 isopentenyldiphosphate isomerase [Paenibacillus shirakamiensis]